MMSSKLFISYSEPASSTPSLINSSSLIWNSFGNKTNFVSTFLLDFISIRNIIRVNWSSENISTIANPHATTSSCEKESVEFFCISRQARLNAIRENSFIFFLRKNSCTATMKSRSCKIQTWKHDRQSASFIDKFSCWTISSLSACSWFHEYLRIFTTSETFDRK